MDEEEDHGAEPFSRREANSALDPQHPLTVEVATVGLVWEWVVPVGDVRGTDSKGEK